MSTFITKLDSTGDGPRVAVKDLIDVEGVPDDGGMPKAVARTATPATRRRRVPRRRPGRGRADRRQGEPARARDAADRHEPVVRHAGQPARPGPHPRRLVERLCGRGRDRRGRRRARLRHRRLGPGAVGLLRHRRAEDDATAGSPLEGVWPLAPSLDTIGPMAATVAGVTLGMQLLEPGFEPAATPRRRDRAGPHERASRHRGGGRRGAARGGARGRDDRLGRSRRSGVDVFAPIYFDEMWDATTSLVEANPDAVGADITAMVAIADLFRPAADEARQALAAWRHAR